jgi:hypothetical protein
MAAIEFRSYQGGQSVIRATSPGLQDGTVTVTTVGNPQFIPGRTPLVPDRPYVRFVNTMQTAAGGQNIALNHPVSSSSETPGHEARLANDGNPATGWQAADAHPGAWWQIDLESVNAITSVESTFGGAANYRYKIEASPDGETWTMLSDQTGTSSTARVRMDACAKNARNRYLRLTITGLPSNHAALVDEVRIFAVPSP